MNDTRTRPETTWARGMTERRRWRAPDAPPQASEEALRGLPSEPADVARDDMADKDATLPKATAGERRRPQRSLHDPSHAVDSHLPKE